MFKRGLFGFPVYSIFAFILFFFLVIFVSFYLLKGAADPPQLQTEQQRMHPILLGLVQQTYDTKTIAEHLTEKTIDPSVITYLREQTRLMEQIYIEPSVKQWQLWIKERKMSIEIVDEQGKRAIITTMKEPTQAKKTTRETLTLITKENKHITIELNERWIPQPEYKEYEETEMPIHYGAWS